MENEKKLNPLDGPTEDSDQVRKVTDEEIELIKKLFPAPEPAPFYNPFKPIRPARWKQWR